MPTLEYDFLCEEERIESEERIVLEDTTRTAGNTEEKEEKPVSVRSKYF